MSIQIISKISKLKQVLLVICMLFYITKGIGQTTAKKVYDSIAELSISKVEKIELFKIKILQGTYADKTEHADVCYLVAKLCFKADWASGISFLKKEMALRKQNKKPNKDLIAKGYYNLGNFYWFQKDYNNALSNYDRLLSYVSEKGKRCGNAYRVIADIYKKTGDYKRSLEHYKQSEIILKKVEAKSELLNTYNNKLSMYVEQEYGVAQEDFEALQLQAIKLANEIKAKDSRRLKILNNSGAMLYHYEEYESSLTYYYKALIIAEKLEDSLAIAKIYTNTALIDVKKENTNEALRTNEKALIFARKNRDQKSIIYDNLGDIYKNKKQHKKGLKYYNKALNELLPFQWKTKENLPQYEEIIKSPNRKNILKYLIDKQNTWLAYYEYTKGRTYVLEAEKTLLLIDKVIDYLYFESKEKMSKLFWRKEGAKLYINAVKICFLLNKPAQAFYYIEKNKGILLLDNISAFSAKRIAKLPQEIIDKEYELDQKVKELEQKMVTSKLQDSLKNKHFIAKETYYKYVTKIEKEYPKYHRYRTSLPILSTSIVQEKIAQNEAVVAYILGDQTGYVLLMNQQNVKTYPLENLRSLKEKLNMFKELCLKPFDAQEDIMDFQQKGNEIYKELFPFRNDSIYQGATKITVIPDGILNSLPLEILPTSSTQNLQESYLIQKKEISYRYSFSLDAQNEVNPIKAKSESSSFMLTDFQDSTLTTLTVKPIELFEEATHVNENATKKNFLKAYNEASQVYVSSHAGNTNDIPWLAMFDGKIYPNELYFLNNPKELVVLNACETSAGVFKEGEGVFSMTRGFLNSGSKSVVATLWNLNEKSGMEIFKSFRSNLKESQTKSEALHNAKLAYLEKHKNTSQSSPYYWGGIVLTGNTDALPVQFNYWWLLVIGLVVVISTFLYASYRKRVFSKHN